MAFLNEYISPEDREHYRFDDFEKRLFMINPQRSWAIDREENIFLRIINPAARGSEPGDPDARFERDYHYHWKGFDYLIAARCGISAQELQNWSGEIFESGLPHPEKSRVFRFYLRHIGEVSKPKPDVSSALKHNRMSILRDLEDILAFSWGGLFTSLTLEDEQEPRYAIFKIAPQAEME
jgi:hypothetical protein